METDLNEEIGYELTFIVKEEDSSKIKQVFQKKGLVLIGERPLQKIRLAYPIKKNIYGFIGMAYFNADPEIIETFEADLKLEGDLLRHALTRVIMKGTRIPRESVKEFKRGSEVRRPNFAKEPSKIFEPALTNEALEKKIEEIMK